MRARFFLAALASLLLGFQPHAFAQSNSSASFCTPTSGSASCLGQSCKNLGSTVMDGDGNSIIACVGASSGTRTTDCSLQPCQWKPMTPVYETQNGGAVSVGVETTAPQARLDVNGEIKVGNSGLACSDSTAGTIRYDSSASSMEFCDGISWNYFGDTGFTCDVGVGHATIVQMYYRRTTSTGIIVYANGGGQRVIKFNSDGSYRNCTGCGSCAGQSLDTLIPDATP